ncbi:YezD family protein [Oleiharenicola lentus]|uniref:YezD family protein n=1 Tax=Oleiharenicola lentus TaxID=2508720 RepID=UPI003F67811A
MSQTTEQEKTDVNPEWLRIVQEKVETLRYGLVQLVVHDGRVTQIERTEKTRLSGPGHRDGSGI